MNELYYLTKGAEQMGPYTLAQLQAMWRSGAVTAKTLYCQEGFNEWLPITSMADLLDPTPPKAPPPVTPVAPVAPPAPVAGGSDKRILPVFILCFFFGLFGAHAFYAGRTRQGLLFLSFWMVSVLVSLLGGSAGVLAWLLLLFVIVFALGDFICIVCGNYQDGQGRKITQWT